MKPNYNKYPSIRQCRILWKIGAESILRNANGESVPVKLYPRGQTVIVHKSCCISPAVIAWVLRRGRFPKTRIFSLNGNNSDLSAANWIEEASDNPNPLDPDVLKLVVRYDSQTGEFFWKTREPRNINDRTWLRSCAGKQIACSLDVSGYLYFKVFGVRKMAHQWAWLYVFGSLPSNGECLDHLNRNKSDNRIKNLRVVPVAVNNLNKPNVKERQPSKPRTKRSNYPTYVRLRECLAHDNEKGAFFWIPRLGTNRQTQKFNTQWAGVRAGRYTGHHPVLIRMDGERYLAQDLLWIFYTQTNPQQRLYCVNGDHQDLRIENWVLEDSPKKPFHELSPAEKRMRLMDRFIYDCESGEFIHKERVEARFGTREINGRKVGRQAGYIQNGYRRITIEKKDYQASHLALLLQKKIWPPSTNKVVDHINGDKLDNRPTNLRLVDKGENSRNRKISPRNQSGYQGVRMDGQSPGKWRAYICVNGRQRTIGLFESFSEARAARISAELDAQNT